MGMLGVSKKLVCPPAEGRTKQSFAEECDINNIMAKYVKTRTITHLNTHGGSYGFAPATDFRESLEVVAKAQEMFMDLPAKVRKRFDNDPEKFLEFVQDDKNLEEARELGLAKAPQGPAEPVLVKVISEAKAEGSAAVVAGEKAAIAAGKDPARPAAQ